ncbi:MAG: rRNA pseudouridine synthase [Anaerolineales bacterium]|nr:rRNA pseudouridine synthase [Anaerolineales bacterium]
MEQRLQKLMAQAGIASRRESEEMIRNGRVKVNGRLAHIGDKADPDKDRIEVDGRKLAQPESQFIYIALNKPKGVLSSTEDEMEQGRQTVRDLIDLPGHLYPVGRLDKQSEGLMLITNDGQLAHRLTHPRYGHEKTYRVDIEGDIHPAQLEQWRQGVMLDGRLTAPVRITVLEQFPDLTRLEIVMREGRKRQIRRIAAEFGHPVLKLKRLRIGPLQLGNLPPGKWRYLKPQEVAALRQAATGKKTNKPTNKPSSPNQRGKS